MAEHPHPGYIPPEHLTYPNAALPSISQGPFLELVNSATTLPPTPIIRISLTKTSRKLTVAAQRNTPHTSQEDSRKMVVLVAPPEVVSRYPKNRLMSTYPLFQHRADKKKSQHYKEKRRAPIPLASTPTIRNYHPGNAACVTPPA